MFISYLEMNSLEIDSELIITEVGKYPVLYDPENGSYKNRTAKLAAWQKIAEAVVGEEYKYLDLDQQNFFGREIQKKWKALKDAYVRSLKLQGSTTGSGFTKKRPYIYHNKMAFLQPLIQSRLTPGNLESLDEDQVDNLDVKTRTSVASPVNPHPPLASTSTTSLPIPSTSISAAAALPKKRKKETFESQLIGFLRENSRPRPPSHEDPNELFFRSLLPKMKKLSDTDLCNFQIDVLQLLQKYLSDRSDRNLSNSSLPTCPTQEPILPQVQPSVNHHQINVKNSDLHMEESSQKFLSDPAPSSPQSVASTGENIVTESSEESILSFCDD